MVSWYESYATGDAVRARVIMATGAVWLPATVVRKTVTGLPVVQVRAPRGEGQVRFDQVVTRKGDISREAGA